MIIQKQIEKKITSELKPNHLEIINDSHKHNVPTGSESHFRALIVSDQFLGKNMVQRQQMVYELLKEEMKDQVHALAMQTYTNEEWSSQNKAINDSPKCLGGSKFDK